MAISSRTTSRPAVNATRARQGRFGRHVLWLLLVSTALAALALFAAWTWRSDDLARVDPNAGYQAADAQTFNQGAPMAKQNEVEPVPGRPVSP
jgi:hypothetical protein